MGWSKFIPLSCLLVLLPPLEVASQDDDIYRYHFIHPAIINPAVTGSEFFPVATMSYQHQWAGIPASPRTMLASASIRIGNFDFYNPRKLINTTNLRSRERIGLGVTAFHDQYGPFKQRGINLAYAYHLTVGRGRLSMGLSGSAEQRQLDGTMFQTTFPNDPLAIPERESFMLYNAHVGAYYYSSGLFGGLAAHHLIPMDDPLQPSQKIKPDFIAHAGYLLSSFGTPRLELSMHARYLNTERMELDLHVRSYIQEYHWLAVSVRSYNALAMHVGIKISKVHLAYTYEANLSNVMRHQLGTHAIHLGMNMGMRRILRL